MYLNKQACLAAIILISLCTSCVVSSNDGTCSYRKWEKAGSMKLQIIAGIHERTELGTCDSKMAKGVLDQLVAIEWITEILNGNTSHAEALIPGQTIGYEIYDNCDIEDITTDLLFSGSMAGAQQDCSLQSDSNSATTIGAISLTNVENTRIISRLVGDTPLFKALPSSPDLSTDTYHNLLQTVVPFSQISMTILNVLKQTGWNFIVVIHTEDEYGSKAAASLQTMATSQGVCVNYTGPPTSASVSKIYSAMSLAIKTSITVVYFGGKSGAQLLLQSVKSKDISSQSLRPYNSKINWVFPSMLADSVDIEDILSDSDNIVSIRYDEGVSNTKFNDFYSSILSSSAPPSSVLDSLVSEYKNGQTASIVHPDIEPKHIIDAVYVLAKAVKDAIENTCFNTSQCLDWSTPYYKDFVATAKQNDINVEEYLNVDVYPYNNKHVTFTDSGLQRYSDIYAYLTYWDTNKAKQRSIMGVSHVDGGYTPRANLPEFNPSACSSYCESCVESVNLRYSYLPGDVLILGLFSIRQYGDSLFSCGHLRRDTNDIITASAFMESVVSRRTSSTSINFGAIAIDDCYSSLNSSSYLMELFSKRRILRDPATSAIINFDNVVAIIGALSSPVTLAVADLSTSLNIPLISYAASSSELDNRNRYPFFLRTVPSDTLQVQGMIQTVVHLGVTHVGLLYIDDLYGRDGKRGLLEAGRARNICIETPLSVRLDMTSAEVKAVIDTLFEKEVRVVLFFSIDSIAQLILQQLNAQNAKRPLVFIASDGWGTNHNLIHGELGLRSLGSLVFTLATKVYTGTNFRGFLSNLNMTQTEHNQWIPNFFEDINECDLITSFEKSFGKTCVKDQMQTYLTSGQVDELYAEQRGVHTKMAVHAATEGYRQYCGQTATCDSRSDTASASQLIEEIKKAQLTDVNMFNEDGNGNIDFTIYNIQLRTLADNKPEVSYVEVGSFNSKDQLQIQQPLKFYNSIQKETGLDDSDEFRNYINCRKYDRCASVCAIPSTTVDTTEPVVVTSPAPTTNSDSSWMTMTIIFGVLVAVMFIALVVVLCMLFRILNRQEKQLSDRGDTGTGYSTSGSGIHDIYDVPASLTTNATSMHFDNNAFVGDAISMRNRPRTPTSTHGIRISNGHGSMSSLNSNVQYADLSYNPNADSRQNHLRQRSNLEMNTLPFCSIDRPASTLSAPMGHGGFKQNVSPMAKRMGNKQQEHDYIAQPATTNKASPKTPNSAPSNFRKHPVVYKPRTGSAPRFRYPSTHSDDYNLPDDGSVESVENKRRLGGVSDDSDTLDRSMPFYTPQQYPHTMTQDNYLTPFPDQDGQHSALGSSRSDSPITYLTSKDFVNAVSDEEEDAIPDDVTATLDAPYKYETRDGTGLHPGTSARSGDIPGIGSGVVELPDTGGNIVNNSAHLLASPTSTTSALSPSDNEVMAINFPETHDNGTDSGVHLDSPHEHYDTGTGRRAKHSSTAPSLSPHRNSQKDEHNNQINSSSIHSVVPDIIKHGMYEEDGVFMI